MVAGRLWGGCSVLPGMLTVFPKELMPGDPCVLDPPFGVNIHRVGWGKVLSSLSLPSTRPRGPFKEQGRGGPAVHEKAHSVPASLQPGLGGEGKGLAEASAHGRRERKAPGQRGVLLGDVTFTQTPTCRRLPGAKLPPRSGGPHNHSSSDQEEMAGSARRPGHSVPGLAHRDAGSAGRM